MHLTRVALEGFRLVQIKLKHQEREVQNLFMLSRVFRLQLMQVQKVLVVQVFIGLQIRKDLGVMLLFLMIELLHID